MRRLTGNTSGLMVLCSVQFLVVLDATVVTTALPAVQSSLGFSDAGLTWVVTAYTLMLGALLVPAGRVADLIGPRRALVTGMGIFVAASVTCAAAWTPAALVAARAAQGLGAALLAPAALALLGVLTSAGAVTSTGAAADDGRSSDARPGDGRRGPRDGRSPDTRAGDRRRGPRDGRAGLDERRAGPDGDRPDPGHGAGGPRDDRPEPGGDGAESNDGRAGRAVGWWTAAGAVGGGSGWVLGGLLTDLLGWPAVFWINLPVGVVAIAAALRVLPAGQRHPGRRVDVRGAILLTAALGLLVHLPWAALAAAAVLLVLFVRHIRHHPDPLIPPRLLRSPAVAGANLTAALLTASTAPAMYLAMLYLQQVRGLAPARAALWFPVFNVGVVAGSLVGPAGQRPRWAALSGFLLVVVGVAGLAAGWFVVAFALVGTGLGAASVASTRAGTDAAVPEHRGVSSGVLTASAQIGTALGLAVILQYGMGYAGAALVAVAGVAAAFLLPRAGLREPVTAGR